MQVFEDDDDVMRDEKWRDAAAAAAAAAGWSERRSQSLTDGIIAVDMCAVLGVCVCGRANARHVQSHRGH